MTDTHKAHDAVVYLLTLMLGEPRLGRLIGPGSLAYALLTEAYADGVGVPAGAFRAEYEQLLQGEENQHGHRP